MTEGDGNVSQTCSLDVLVVRQLAWCWYPNPLQGTDAPPFLLLQTVPSHSRSLVLQGNNGYAQIKMNHGKEPKKLSMNAQKKLSSLPDGWNRQGSSLGWRDTLQCPSAQHNLSPEESTGWLGVAGRIINVLVTFLVAVIIIHTTYTSKRKFRKKRDHLGQSPSWWE